MPRKASVLTLMQQNETVFKPFVAELRKITPQVLAREGKVSDGTIYKYMKGKACAMGVEELILESLELFKQKRIVTETDNQNRAKQLIAD